MRRKYLSELGEKYVTSPGEKKLFYIFYAKTFFGLSLSQPLNLKDFTFEGSTAVIEFLNTKFDAATGYLLEVDSRYLIGFTEKTRRFRLWQKKDGLWKLYRLIVSD